MREWQDRIAVVTGAASGIGRALSWRFARAGMKIMLADIEADPLDATVQDLRDAGFEATAVRCNVARLEEVEVLAATTLRIYGAAHVVCNNAGVILHGRAWQHDHSDWQWALGVNVWGVINGVTTFAPILLRQKVEGHIVNTASAAGLASYPRMGLYCLTKHAVVAFTESLHHDLVSCGDLVRCSVLCPAFVPTAIASAGRNRPSSCRGTRTPDADDDQFAEALSRAIQSGRLSAEDIANETFDAIRDRRFYIIPHRKILEAVDTRVLDMVSGRDPTNTMSRQPG